MLSQITLLKYLTWKYIKQFIISSVLIIFVLFITSAFDTLQKFKSSNLSSGEFWQLIIYKIPFIYNEVSILIVFIATILYIRSLSNNSELVVMLSSGIPIWRIFTVPIVTSVMIGCIIVMIINPLGTNGLRRYIMLESKITGESKNSLVVSPAGLFFADRENEENKIFRAKALDVKNSRFSDVTMLLLDDENSLIKRIDAKSAILKNGMLNMHDAKIITQNKTVVQKQFSTKVSMSIKDIVKSFNPPEMIHLWHLKSDIEKFIKSGISVIKYQLYFYKQIFKPLAMVAMTYVACWFVGINPRDNSSNKAIIMAAITGIMIYFILEISFRTLAYNGITPLLAIMLPIIFIIIISNFVILHFQEA